MEFLGFIGFLLVIRAIYQLCTWTVEDHKNAFKSSAGRVAKGGSLLRVILKRKL